MTILIKINTTDVAGCGTKAAGPWRACREHNDLGTPCAVGAARKGCREKGMSAHLARLWSRG